MTEIYPRDNSNRVLLKNPIFKELPEQRLEEAKRFFGLYEQSYGKDEIIKRQGEKMQFFGIVLEGSVIVYMDDIDGNQMIMANVLPSETFGQAHSFLSTQEIPVYIKAFSDCRVAWLSLESIKNPGKTSPSLYSEMLSRYIGMLSGCMLSMNDRIQILSKSTLRGKLKTFFSQCEHKYGKSTFDISMSRYDLAVYLGTNRSALSRELSSMKDEGIIEFYKSSFKIKKH